jgi:hypothetical protein
MSAERDIELALRQQRLLLRSAALRDALAEQSIALQAPLATADRAIVGARWLYRQRAWVAGGLAVVLVMRPRRAWRVLRFGGWLWLTARRVQPWLVAAGLLAPTPPRY